MEDKYKQKCEQTINRLLKEQYHLNKAREHYEDVLKVALSRHTTLEMVEHTGLKFHQISALRRKYRIPTPGRRGYEKKVYTKKVSKTGDANVKAVKSINRNTPGERSARLKFIADNSDLDVEKIAHLCAPHELIAVAAYVRDIKSKGGRVVSLPFKGTDLGKNR